MDKRDTHKQARSWCDGEFITSSLCIDRERSDGIWSSSSAIPAMHGNPQQLKRTNGSTKIYITQLTT